MPQREVVFSVAASRRIWKGSVEVNTAPRYTPSSWNTASLVAVAMILLLARSSPSAGLPSTSVAVAVWAVWLVDPTQFQARMQRAFAEELQAQGWRVDLRTATCRTPTDLSPYDIEIWTSRPNEERHGLSDPEAIMRRAGKRLTLALKRMTA
jgi:hypothetical protein